MRGSGDLTQCHGNGISAPSTVDVRDEQDEALRLLDLFLAQRNRPPSRGSWVERRIESVSILDESMLQRSVKLEFEPPETLGGRLGGDQRIPVEWLPRAKLRALDVRDAEGRAVPFLTREESGRLAKVALGGLVKELFPSVSDELRADVTAELEELATGNSRQRGKAMQNFAKDAGRSFDDSASPTAPGKHWLAYQRWKVMGSRDGAVASFLQLLARNVVLIVVMPSATGRQVLQIRYCRRYVRSHESRRQWLFVRLGWVPEIVSFGTPMLQHARSFHCEFHAPPDLYIPHIALALGRKQDEADGESTEEGGETSGGTEERGDATHLRPETEVPGETVDIDSGSPGQVLYVASRGTGLPRKEGAGGEIDWRAAEPLLAGATVRAELRIQRTGFLPCTAFTTLLCTVILFGVWFSLDEVRSQPEVGVALLVVVPGLLATYLFRPSEHATATVLLSAVRLMVVTVISCSILASCLLVLDIDATLRRWLWAWLVLVAAATWVAVGTGYLLNVDAANEARVNMRRASTEASAEPRGIFGLALFLVVIGILFGVAYAGHRLHDPDPATRIDAALKRAQRGQPGTRLVPLDALTVFPWTRLYVFKPNTPSRRVTSVIGTERLDLRTWRSYEPPRQVPDEATLLIFLNGGAVVREIRYPTDEEDFSCLASTARSDYLKPNQSIRVRPETRYTPPLVIPRNLDQSHPRRCPALRPTAVTSAAAP